VAKWVLPDTSEMSKVHSLMQEHNISATKLAEIIKDYLDEQQFYEDINTLHTEWDDWTDGDL